MPRKLILLFCVVGAGCGQGEAPYDEPQPHDPAPQLQVDHITQRGNPTWDILFLVDNSCSMADKQVRLIKELPGFVQDLEDFGIDYHIGAISTDMTDNGSPEPTNTQGRLRPDPETQALWVDGTTPAPAEVLSRMVDMGEWGSADERGREPLILALDDHRDDWNRGFLRDEAALHVIAFTDEDDFACGYSAGPCGTPSREDFIWFMQDLKAPEQGLSFSGIVNRPDQVPPAPEKRGIEYIAYALALGGVLTDIQQDGWFDDLTPHALQTASLPREFLLSRLPVPDTLEVQVIEPDGAPRFFEPDDWLYDGQRNSVTFLDYTPPAAATVELTYAIDGG